MDLKLIVNIVLTVLIYYLYYLYFKIKTSEKYHAFIRLCFLDKETVEKYMKSYDILFDRDDMLNSLDDYKKKVKLNGYKIDNQSEKTVDCYFILKDLCTLGNVQKMYIPPLLDNTKNLPENQNLTEQLTAKHLNVREDETILELGCGCGQIADNMSNITNCNVYGINIDDTQIVSAINYSKKHDNKKTHFKIGDFNKPLEFEDNYFDGIYTVGAPLTYSNNLVSLFKEMYRIVKPGKFICLQEVTLLDNFNKQNEKHLELARLARMVMAAGGLWHNKYWEKAAKKAGFEIIISEVTKTPDNLPVPDLPLLKKEHEHYGNLSKYIEYLNYIPFFPTHLRKLFQRLRMGGDALIEAEQHELLTMNWQFVFKKPEN